MKDTIVIGASIAQKPGYGGHTWVFLQYLLGFRRLGWKVMLLDRLTNDMCYDAAGDPCAGAASENVRYLSTTMERFGLGDDFSLMGDGGETIAGRSRDDVLDCLRRSALLVNVMGFVDDPELLAAANHRVFLDIDPGLAQIWCDLKLHDAFTGHDSFVTIGENIGREDCPVPTCGLHWITSPQPVVLDEWPAASERGGAITSVGSWRGANGVLNHGGRRYGQRVHEFRRFLALPQLTSAQFELALSIHPADTADLRGLADHGWTLVDPRVVAGDPDTYRDYIRDSAAELMIAKGLYAVSQCGWFSDRSICYLASGRPVIAQDTGIDDLYPTSTGLLTFTTVQEAAAAVDAVTADYERHARAARELAEAHFDSDLVLGRLLGQLEVA